MSEYGHVAVLMGGWSEERPISLISGQCAYEALCARDVEASAVDLQRETLPQLAEQGFDRCFLALHGIGGEDGEVQQALEEMGLPYSGSGPEASRVCMDKLETKKRWWRAGLPEAMERELAALAFRAFECTGAKGYGRVDLILDELDRPWLLEVNTAPGLRRHSLLPMAAEAAGLDYEDLILKMLDTSLLQVSAEETVDG